MTYTDRENEVWWSKKSAIERDMLFSDILEKLKEGSYAHGFVSSLQLDYDEKGSLTGGQIAALRKYADKL